MIEGNFLNKKMSWVWFSLWILWTSE